MGDQHVRNKKPRKIVGNGSVTEFLKAHSPNNNKSRNLSTNQAQHQSAQLLLNNNSNGTNIAALSSPLTLQQQQHQQQQQSHYRHQMERLRIAGIMNQEMHPLWPYAPFLSPILPAPNMALPYALTGTLPYATVPIYHGGPQQCTLSPVSSNTNASPPANHQPQQQQQSINMRSNIPNNLSSLPCASQNMLSAYISTNDTTAKLNLSNFCGLNQNTPSSADKDNKEPSSSLRNSPTLSELNDSTNTTNNGTGDDSSKGSSPNTFTCGTSSNNNNGATVTLSQTKFNDLTRLALRGSEIAEKLAYTHRNRPCFKKIDSLCARMKQDLIRPDGVLPNINSQGIAWAVKDFIFVFTRVINAWIIIKGYVYNTPEGLNKVKAALSPDFQASFAAWQDTTMDFIENLIKSFVNLDNLVQSQKNAYQKTENGQVIRNTNITPIKILQSGNSLLDDATFDFLNNSIDKQQNSINKNYIYTMVEDSEGSQRQATVNGTYFKTGTYNPIKKEAFLNQSQTHDVDSGGDNSNCNNNTNNNNNSNNSPSKQSIFTAIQSTTATPPRASAPASPGHAVTNNSSLIQYLDDAISEFWPAAEMYTTTTTTTKTTTTTTTITTTTVVTTATAGEGVTATTTLQIGQKTLHRPSNWLRYDLRVLEKSTSKAITTTTTSATTTTITTKTTTVSDGGGDTLITFDNSNCNSDTTTIAVSAETVDATTTPTKMLSKDLVDKFNIMIERLMSMKNADLFFKLQFTKNYFPDFIARHKTDFMDVRSIILKCQIGGYHNIHEVVHDVRKIVFAGKEFLKINNDAKLQKSLIAFEAELNKLLSEPPFDNYHFEHITGESKEYF